MFIVVEGVDGCGKTTVAKLLQKKLSKILHTKVIYYRAPDGPIRNVLLKRPKGTIIDNETELLLFIAAHRWLLTNKVIPALECGAIVVLDRFTDSTLSYQGGGRELGVDYVNNLIQKHIFEPFGERVKPDMTFYIEAQEQIREERLALRANLDHMDRLGLEFRRRNDEVMNLLYRTNKTALELKKSTMSVQIVNNSFDLEQLSNGLDWMISDYLPVIRLGLIKHLKL